MVVTRRCFKVTRESNIKLRPSKTLPTFFNNLWEIDFRTVTRENENDLIKC